MRKTLLLLLTVIVSTTWAASAQAPQAAGYLTPPKAIVDILDAEPLATTAVSPDGRTLAIFRRTSMPGIDELAEPMLRLAGHRINPKTSGPHGVPRIISLTFKPIAGGADRPVTLPARARLMPIGFSPDGKKLAFGNVRPTGIELWIADVATGLARSVAGAALSATFGAPCDWVPGIGTPGSSTATSIELVCTFVPEGRGPAPAAPHVPASPNVLEHSGKAAPAATYQDLLETEQDARLFEHYFTSQLAYVDTATGRRTNVGRPGIIERATASPDGQYLLVSRLKRPFSFLVQSDDFAKDVEIWSRRGELARTIADLPVAETVPINGVPTGPRGYRWHSVDPATVVWAEALDEGDPRKDVPHRDRIVTLKAPFGGSPTEVGKTEFRFSDIGWTDAGLALVAESDRRRRWSRTWIIDAPGAEPRKLWDVSSEDRYNNPGSPVARRGADGGFGGGGFGGGGIPDRVRQHGEWIYTTGNGASAEGDRPFLDRVNLKTLVTERLFRSESDSYETVEALLSDDATRILTSYETRTDPPNLCVRDRGLSGGSRQAVTSFKDPYPQITAATKNRQFVTYKRDDGVQLSGTLFVPADRRPGERPSTSSGRPEPAEGRVPMLVWAYPREFTNPGAASQVVGSPNRFISIGGASHLLLLTQGYAIFDGPTMPIVGKGETANDQYVDQLVASARAAIDKAVEMGIADRDRVAVGGHSYGAFMTVNLLAHSDLFRAGIARSGAYNRTLTPFGFQNERRTFWEARDVYARMSPFFYADKINEPILLIHGEADNNSGTFPIQSERLYMALKGHGATVRYVTLPLEAHGYAARESVLHTVAEMLNWMDKWVKSAGPRQTTTANR